MPDFSIFLAAIRPQNWQALYDSIKVATKREFELIFVGPYPLPDSLKDTPNVKFIQDYGCPTRCYQIGLLACASPYVIFTADDGVFLNNGVFDNALFQLEKESFPTKKIISFRYYEGPRIKNNPIEGVDWWRMGYHQFYSDLPYVPNEYLLVMTALVSRDYMIKMGGWDCNFKHLGIGAVDLAVRMQRDGAEVDLEGVFMEMTHSPGHMGDHGPIHDSHCQEDMPYFQKIYSDPTSVTRKIDINNWMNVPDVWDRRFPSGKPN